MLNVNVRHARDGTTVITAVGAVDTSTAARLSTTVHHELDSQPATLVLDLTGVTSVDAAGLQVLRCVTDRAAASAIPIRLVGPKTVNGEPGPACEAHAAEA